VRASASWQTSARNAVRRSVAVSLDSMIKYNNDGGVIVKQFIANLMFGTLFAVVGAAIAAGDAADPVVGTWKLDVAKSTFGASPAVKAQTRAYSQSARGITLNMRTVGADGKEITVQTTYQFDGKDYPVTGTADYGSLSAKQIDANTAEFTLKKGGKTVGTTRRTVSKDGKTLTATNEDAKGEDTLIFNIQ
jgi:hypothetical protein